MASLEDFNNTEIVVVRNGSSSSSRTDCNSLCYHWSFGAVVLERLFLVSYLIVIAMLNVIIFVGCYCATM